MLKNESILLTVDFRNIKKRLLILYLIVKTQAGD